MVPGILVTRNGSKLWNPGPKSLADASSIIKNQMHAPAAHLPFMCPSSKLSVITYLLFLLPLHHQAACLLGFCPTYKKERGKKKKKLNHGRSALWLLYPTDTKQQAAISTERPPKSSKRFKRRGHPEKIKHISRDNNNINNSPPGPQFARTWHRIWKKIKIKIKIHRTTAEA